MSSSITGVAWQEPTLKLQGNFTEEGQLLGRKALSMKLESSLTKSVGWGCKCTSHVHQPRLPAYLTGHRVTSPTGINMVMTYT